MNSGLYFICAALVVLAIGLARFERKTMTIHEIALTAFLISLAGLGRVAFAFIPSAKPTTFIVMMSGLVFGPTIGFLVGAFGALLSNFFLGQGPWTIMQMLAWGLCGISAGFLPRIFPYQGKWLLIVFGFCWGFLFAWIMNVWYWLSFVYPLTWKTWIAANIASFWFDLTHAITNVLFISFFSQQFIKILKRFKDKMHYQIIKNTD